jgi:hypothetical protein
MKNLFIFIVFISSLFSKVKGLHISFHQGCIGEIKKVCSKLNIDLDSWNILDSEPLSFNGVSPNSHNYIMTHLNADLIFKKHKNRFSSYDIIIVSDIAPLSRIFLQNNWKKPLIIWVCNRFDINAKSSGEQVFPDKEYLTLFQNAANLKNVAIVGYTEYESFHAEKNRGVTSINKIINPTGLDTKPLGYKPISPSIDKKNSFFVRRYINENKLNIWSLLKKLGIKHYSGVYAGSSDLKDFKGMIHIPSVISNFHLFENLHQGIIHYIPSKKFFKELYESNKIEFYDWTQANKRNSKIPIEEIFTYCEWYKEDLSPLFVFFDSFEEISLLAENLNVREKKEIILNWSKKHINKCLSSWKDIFNTLL